MAVTAANKVSTSMTLDLAGPRVVRSYEITYDVHTDSNNDGPISVVLSTYMPSRTTYYAYGSDYDPFAYFKGYSSIALREQDKSYRLWRAVAKFDTQQSQNDKDPMEDTSPFDEPVRWNGSFFVAQKMWIAGRTARKSRTARVSRGGNLSTTAGQRSLPPIFTRVSTSTPGSPGSRRKPR